MKNKTTLALLDEKLYLEDTIAITIDGQVIYPFTHPLFAVYRREAKSYPLLIRKTELSDTHVAERIKQFLKKQHSHQEETLKTIINNLTRSIFRIHSDPIKRLNEIKTAIYLVVGFGTSDSKAAGINKIFLAHANKPLTNTMIQELSDEIIKISNQRVNRDINDIGGMIDEANKLLAPIHVSEEMRPKILEEFNHLLQNSFTNPSLIYLSQQPDFIILKFSKPATIESLSKYTLPNYKKTTTPGGLSLIGSRLIAISTGEPELPARLLAIQEEILHPLPASYGGLTGKLNAPLFKNTPSSTSIIFNSFSKLLCEELQDQINPQLEKHYPELFEIESPVDLVLSKAKQLEDLANKIIKKDELTETESAEWKKIKKMIQNWENDIQPHNRVHMLFPKPGKNPKVGDYLKISGYFGDNVNFKVLEAEKDRPLIVEAPAVNKGDKMAQAHVLKELGYELQFHYFVSKNMYKEKETYLEYIGKINYLFIKYGKLAEYALADLMPFYSNQQKLIDSLNPSTSSENQEKIILTKERDHLFTASVSLSTKFFSAPLYPEKNPEIPPPEINKPVFIELKENACTVEIAKEKYHFTPNRKIETIEIKGAGEFIIKGLATDQKIDFKELPIIFTDLRLEQTEKGIRIIYTPHVDANTVVTNSLITREQLEQQIVINLPDIKKLQPCQMTGNDAFNASNIECNPQWYQWAAWAISVTYNPYVVIPITIAVALYQHQFKEHSDKLYLWLYETTGINFSLPENSVIRLALDMSLRTLLGWKITSIHDYTLLFKQSFTANCNLSNNSFSDSIKASFWAIKNTATQLARTNIGHGLASVWDTLRNENHSYWWAGLAGTAIWDLIKVLLQDRKDIIKKIELTFDSFASSLPGYTALTYAHSLTPPTTLPQEGFFMEEPMHDDIEAASSLNLGL